MACKRMRYMHGLGHKVACGVCPDCDRRYINSWVFRLILESQSYPPDQTTFLTLTYKDEKLPLTSKEAKKQFQLFMNRLRNQFGYWVDGKRKLRYAASLERGDKYGRYHWHVILFGISFQWEVKQWLAKIWSNGFIDWRPASVKAIRYVLKYVLKSRTARRRQGSSQPDTALTGCWLMSRRPGLGSTQLPAIVKTLDSLSQKSVAALHGSKSAILTPWKNKPIAALRYGNLLYPMHRYLQERLRVRALVPTRSEQSPTQNDIQSINNTCETNTVEQVTVNNEKKK